MDVANYRTVAFLSSIISAKWALDPGYSGDRQLLWFVGGFILGPFGPAILYLILARKG